jgi:hypothetical protein
MGGTTARTLASITEPKVCQPKFLDIILKGDTLVARIGLFNERPHGREVFTRTGTVESTMSTCRGASDAWLNGTHGTL